LYNLALQAKLARDGQFHGSPRDNETEFANGCTLEWQTKVIKGVSIFLKNDFPFYYR
jgi:hypothetical protein